MSKILLVFMLLCRLVNSAQIIRPLSTTDESLRNTVESALLSHVFKERIPHLLERDDLLKRDRVHNGFVHQVIFVIKQSNMEELTRILHDVSDPGSSNYGQHLTREDVVSMTSNPTSRDAVVRCLERSGATLISESLGGEYVTANATIAVWERLFSTEFFSFQQTDHHGRLSELVRAEKYSIPKELEMHVESVFNTIQIPHQVFGDLPVLMTVPVSEDIHAEAYSFTGYITPSKLKAYYNLGGGQGSARSTQAIFAALNQYFSPSDLSYFQSYFGYSSDPVAKVVGNYASDTKCATDASNCDESNLDLQYIMTTSPGSPTTYWYTDQSFGDWLVSVANTASPPLVISISYGSEETYMTSSEMSAFSAQAMKLGVMGVTLVAASGDDGAISRRVRTYGSSACSYSPLFPASNPYVTAVGGTSGPEYTATEVVCQGDKGYSITSGGGFSTYYSQPAFQQKAVASYFTAATAANTRPYPGYALQARGYPDVSLAAYNYVVYIGKAFYGVSGTSASAPTVAGFFSNINAARMAGGRGSLGWANPVLYSNSSLFVNDITSGNNKCGASGTCCSHGFTATTGWDPATGLGSIDYTKMQSFLVTLGIPSSGTATSPTPKPTMTPTSTIITYLSVTQTLQGVTSAQAYSTSFATALKTAVGSVLGVSSSISISSVTGGLRRLLTTDATLKYAITVNSGVSSDVLIAKYKTSLTNGAFLSSLNLNSGLSMSLVSTADIANLSPTSSPVTAPSNAAAVVITTSIIIIAAVVGAFVFSLIAMIILCCVCRKRRNLALKAREQESTNSDPFPIGALHTRDYSYPDSNPQFMYPAPAHSPVYPQAGPYPIMGREPFSAPHDPSHPPFCAPDTVLDDHYSTSPKSPPPPPPPTFAQSQMYRP